MHTISLQHTCTHSFTLPSPHSVNHNNHFSLVSLHRNHLHTYICLSSLFSLFVLLFPSSHLPYLSLFHSKFSFEFFVFLFFQNAYLSHLITRNLSIVLNPSNKPNIARICLYSFFSHRLQSWGRKTFSET